MSKGKKSGILFLITLVVLGVLGFIAYKKFFSTVKLTKGYVFIYIERGDTFENVMDVINGENIVKDAKTFEWLAKKMDLDQNINPGKYRIINGMTMRQIVNLIKYNKQEKIKLNFNSQIHNLDDFIEYTADKLQMNEGEIEEYLSDEKKLATNFGLDPDNAFALITPGSYEVSWAINTDELFTLLKNKHKAIWNDKRITLAGKSDFSISEIITLASIVQNESGIESEQEKIAGVYVNRLKKGMLLQADPTLKFANKKWNAQRIYDVDKETNSPYNTYKFKGLPPGPISLVNIQALDATLNYSRHNFIYFCAKPELNGYSDFSSNYDQHMRYANAYQKAMNKKGIK